MARMAWAFTSGAKVQVTWQGINSKEISKMVTPMVLGAHSSMTAGKSAVCHR